MLHLLKLEWLKQKNYIVFKAIVILYVIALPSILLLAKTIDAKPEDMPPFMPSIDFLFMFPNVWEWLGYIGNWLSFFFFGFLAVLMVTNEFSNRTLRQNIITGLDRKDFFISKISFLIFICLAATLYYTFWCLLFGFTHTDTIYTNTVLKNSDYIYRFFLMNVGYMSFGFLLGLLIKRTGIALFMYLVYIMVLESILRGLHLYYLKHPSMHYYPMNSIEDLAPMPFADMAEGFAKSNGFSMFLSPTLAILLSSIFIFCFLIFSYWRLKKLDL